VIQVYKQSGELLRKWDCDSPYAMTVADDHVFICSGEHVCKMRQFTLEGTLVREWGAIEEPRRILVSEDEIFITEYEKCRVIVFSKEGSKLREWGINGSNRGQFWGPSGIAINDDLVYVVDQSNERVQAFTRNGTYRFEVNIPNSELEWIFIVNNIAYVTDWGQKVVHLIELK